MHILEPCCIRRQLLNLRDSIENGGRTQFQGYGDLSITELLPALLARYTETEMMIVAPTMPDQATEVITRWMRQQWPHANGIDKLNVVRQLTIITDLSPAKSPVMSDWVKDNPFTGRLVLVDRPQADTAILLPDIAITGPLNLRYGQNFVCTVTTVPEEVRNLWEQYMSESKKKPTQQDVEPVKRPARKRKFSSAVRSKR